MSAEDAERCRRRGGVRRPRIDRLLGHLVRLLRPRPTADVERGSRPTVDAHASLLVVLRRGAQTGLAGDAQGSERGRPWPRPNRDPRPRRGAGLGQEGRSPGPLPATSCSTTSSW